MVKVQCLTAGEREDQAILQLQDDNKLKSCLEGMSVVQFILDEWIMVVPLGKHVLPVLASLIGLLFCSKAYVIAQLNIH